MSFLKSILGLLAVLFILVVLLIVVVLIKYWWLLLLLVLLFVLLRKHPRTQTAPAPMTADRMIACLNCGRVNPANGRFCSECGSQLGAPP
jgi:1,4-dihydroxy-2-naphthoate octaprenyltransferase